MYKHFKTGKKHEKTLYRGTSKNVIREINGTGIISRFISTSSDKNRAKSFIRRENPLLLEVEAEDDVPFLDIEEYRDKEEQTISEDEILLSPFCSAENYQYIGDDFSKLKLKKTKFKQLPSEEIEKLEERLTNEYEQNVKNIERYIELSDEIESLELKINYTYKKKPTQARDDDINAIEEEIKKLEAERDNIGKDIEDYRKKLQTLLQAKCRQKELEIDEVYKIIEEEQKAQFEEIKKKFENMPNQIQNIINFLTETDKEVKKREETYKKVAQELGIEYNLGIEKTNISVLIDNVQINIAEIKAILEENNILEMEYSQSNFETAQKLEGLIDTVSTLSEATVDSNYYNIINKYANDSLECIKESLYSKVQSTIRGTRINKYSQEIKSIENEKRRFLDKITGKEAKREERLRDINIRLREILLDESSNSNESYSVRKMLADIYACAITEFSCTKPSQMPAELRDLYENIKCRFGSENQRFSDEYIKSLAQEKISQTETNPKLSQENLPATIGKTKLFGRKTKIKELRAQNVSLAEEISILEHKSSNFRDNQRSFYSEGLEVFYNIVSHVNTGISRAISNMQYRGRNSEPVVTRVL